MIFTCLLLKNTNIRAIALFPFIFIKHKEDKGNPIFRNHERIHLRQQLEMLVIPFYLWYGIESMTRRIKGNKSPYKSISFEKEAFAHQNDLGYLKSRKWFAWFRYI